MSEKHKQIQEQSVPTVEVLTVEKPIVSVSPNHDIYKQKMSEYDQIASNRIKNILSNRHDKENIQFHSHFVSEFQLTIQEQNINREVIVLNAEWGHFSMKIKVLNIKGPNTKHVFEHDRGAYGSIYKGTLNQDSFIIKCMSLQFKDSRFRAIKQWFLMKIASAAGAAPQLIPYFGFDILMFEQCIEFAMEACEPVSVHNSRIDHFYENLAVLHKLSIVHQDIKPENIMYSPSFDRAIFIDFGLSRIIDQKIGTMTLTNYVGTVQFWSPDMGKCFASKKPRMVDLYYNDLFGLQKSIDAFKIHNLYSTNDESQIFSAQSVQFFDYLRFILSKYYIYSYRYKDFQQLYNKIKQTADKDTVSLFESEFFQFLQEFSPNNQLRYFFRKFVPKTQIQMPLYSKLKLLDQICLRNLFSVEIFRNQDKYNYFTNICNQIFDNEKKDFKTNENENIAKIMRNKQTIKSTPFIKYLISYLDYTSYICNYYQVSPQNRVSAAKIYYELFVKGDNIQELSDRQIIEATINNALRRCLNQNQESLWFHEIPFVLFKIYDFINILDMGTSDQFIKWIDQIYSHPSFTNVYKKIFILRVKQSKWLQFVRLFPKKDVSRIQFIDKIEIILNSKIQQIGIKYFKRQALLEDVKNIPNHFYKHFFKETIDLQFIFFQNNHIEDDKKLIEFYYKMQQNNNNNQKLMYFISLIYRIGLKIRQNDNLSKQIENIFSSCIRDASIMQQFSFYLETELIYNNLFYNNTIVTVKQLKQIDEYLKKVHSEDLLLIKQSLYMVWNKVQYLRNHFEQYDLTFLFQKEGFIARIMENQKQRYFNNIKKLTKQHDCGQTINFYELILLSKGFSISLQKQIKDYFMDQKFWLTVNCQKCKNIKTVVLVIDELQHYLVEYVKKTNNINQDSQFGSKSLQCIIESFFSKYVLLQNYARINDNLNESEQRFLLKGLEYGQLFCSLEPKLEDKYQGIYKNYVLLVKFKRLDLYFNILDNSYKLKKLLNTIFTKKSINDMVVFLYYFTELIRNTLMAKWYDKFLNQFYALIFNSDISLIEILYERFCMIEKQIKEKRKQQTSYFSLIHICFFALSRGEPMYSKSLKATIKGAQHLPSNFKRKVLITIYDKLVHPSIKRSCWRKWIKLKNTLVKLLMIDGQTVKNKSYKQKGSIYKILINSKISKIEIWDRIIPPLKFGNK